MNSLNVKHQGKSSNQLAFQAFMKTLKSDISEAYKVQVDSDSYDKNDMKKKVNDLVRLHEAMQEKLKTASYSEQIQILILVPEKWSRMYCSEYSNVFEYLVSTSHEIKKAGETLEKPAPKKSTHLVTNVYQDDKFST